MAEEQQTPPTAARQRAILNVREVEPGARVSLTDGSIVEVVENPKDGMWLICRYVSSPDDPDKAGTMEEVFAQDVTGLAE